MSDITWAKKVKHPKELLKKDQEVDAIVTNIDKHGQRLSLSMKDLMPSAWESFVATHRPGDIVRGKVSRFTSFGIFVELGEGLEGLCHISELSDERVESADQVAKLGEEMDFKILRIEYEDQKIGLSRRAVGKDDEPVVDTKMYSTEAKGGMASLAELANLKIGKAEEPTEAKKDKPKKAKSESAAEEDTPAVETEETVETPSVEAKAPAEAPAEAAPEDTTEEEAAASDSTSETPAEEAPTAVEAETTAPVAETDAAAGGIKEESETKSA